MKGGFTLGDFLDELDNLERRPRPPDAACRKPRRPPKVKKLKPMYVPPGALSDAEVVLVRQLRAYGLSYGEIQDKFDDRLKPPSLSAIRRICRGQRRVQLK